MTTLVSQLEFNAKAWNHMPQTERVHRCLMFAHEAKQLASNAAPAVKDAYVDLAKQWLALAAEIEKTNPAVCHYPN